MKIFHAVERYIATALPVLMGLGVMSVVIELAYNILINMIETTGFLVGVAELMELFGLLLISGIGFLIISLSAGYYLLKIRHKSAATI